MCSNFLSNIGWPNFSNVSPASICIHPHSRWNSSPFICQTLRSISSVVTAGGRTPPDAFHQKFLLTYMKRGKERQVKKGKWTRKVGKLGKIVRKGKVENLKNWREIIHFSKPLKFVWGVPKWEFLPGKNHLTPGKNWEKWLWPPALLPPPKKKILLLRHWVLVERSFLIAVITSVCLLQFEP